MLKRATSLLLVFVLALMIQSPGAYAQTSEELAQRGAGPRKQMATIIFSGLAGAILGLSTLSFYGRPQDKLSNIAIGFALGVIGGATFTTYKAATRPYEYLDNAFLLLDQKELKLQARKPITLSYNWDF